MGFATVPQVALSAAALLNDQSQSLFTTALLLPYINHAYHDLLFAVDMAQLPLVKEVSSSFTVGIGETALTIVPDPPPNFPPARAIDEMIRPIKLEERALGSSENFVPMIESEWETNRTPIDRLVYWSWRQDVLRFPAATTAREVRVYYVKDLDVALTAADYIPVNRGDDFVAHRTAEYAAKYVLQDDARADKLKEDANDSLEKLIKTLVRSRQNMPVRRRPFGYKWRAIRRYW